MKTILKTVFVLMFLVNSFNSYSQEYYIRVGGGFIGQSGKTEFNNVDPNGITGIEQSTDITISADGSSATVKALNGTMGGGAKFNITGGYMFNKHFGAEFGITYFHGAETLIGRFRSPNMFSVENAYIRGFDVMPGIIINAGYEKINPYLRAGAILTASGKLNIETEVTQFNGAGQGTDIEVKAKSEVTSKFSVGFGGAAGVTYPISDKLNFFCEVEFKTFSIQSKSAEIVEYSTMAVTGEQSSPIPGQQLEDLPKSEKNFIFSDSHVQSTIIPHSEDEPRVIPTQYVNVSGTGVNIGVSYSF
ncbi:outer membrane beta-barrel protein [Urechidicola croceus]|uniref:Outer membrane protein beta-barrel domain-containing protein n=1 Tax=Urechidicola croceus TaxID=1850246 RepID=A0A1D8P5I0_9FLAO|nr:outer membrane beta-barrel protein [Urechidicola croceus]AOW19811.1 hypothetical protein LPB138_03540 [Urechidicola croceus]